MADKPKKHPRKVSDAAVKKETLCSEEGLHSKKEKGGQTRTAIKYRFLLQGTSSPKGVCHKHVDSVCVITLTTRWKAKVPHCRIKI